MRTNLRQSEDKLSTQLETQLETTPPNSNSILSSKNTNTPLEETENPVSKGQLNIFELPDDWQEIDLTNIENNSLINFTEKHLRTVYKNQTKKNTLMSADDIQQSLNSFSHNVEHNGDELSKILRTARPLNFILGLLSKGNEWNPIGNYKDPVEDALRAYQQKLKKKSDQKKSEEEKTKAMAFEDWLLACPESQKETIPFYKPEKTDSENKFALMAYFSEHEWPKIFEEIKNNGGGED